MQKLTFQCWVRGIGCWGFPDALPPASCPSALWIRTHSAHCRRCSGSTAACQRTADSALWPPPSDLWENTSKRDTYLNTYLLWYWCKTIKKEPELDSTQTWLLLISSLSQIYCYGLTVRNDRVYLRWFRNTVAITSFVHQGRWTFVKIL